MTATTVVINDPTGDIYGDLPTYRWGNAPRTLATRRQLSEQGLRKNGHDPVAVMIRPRRRRPNNPLIAYLYDTNLAAPKRPFAWAKLAAVYTAAAARRRCDYCGPVPYIPQAGICNDCRETRKVAA